MAIEHNGDLYSCDHYVYPINKLGNIKNDLLHTMVSSDQQIKFGLNKKMSLPEYCIKHNFPYGIAHELTEEQINNLNLDFIDRS